MGLDMYLEKRTYVKNWDHMKPEERHEISVNFNGAVRPDIKPERISYITEQVAYWRKANHIHAWFVKNAQGGVDDCDRYPVSRDQLVDLVTLCQVVLELPEVGPEKLPRQAGFFFGNTEYDEDYRHDLRDTVEMLIPILQEVGHVGSRPEFFYQSSW